MPDPDALSTDAAPIRADIALAEQRLLEAAHELTDELSTGPSGLPGWDRARVVAHLTTLADALARQAVEAANGALVDVYDGGALGRASAINIAASISPVGQAAALRKAIAHLEASWPDDDEGWTAEVTFASGTVFDVLLGWWREVRIHLVDLSIGESFSGWPPALYEHLWEFLQVRLPAGQAYRLESKDSGLSREVTGSYSFDDLGAGDSAPVVVISGTDAEITCWIAGRDLLPLPQATVAGNPIPLPEIGPWPSPRSLSSS